MVQNGTKKYETSSKLYMICTFSNDRHSVTILFINSTHISPKTVFSSVIKTAINVVVMIVCRENNMKLINTLCERNEESLNVDVAYV